MPLRRRLSCLLAASLVAAAAAGLYAQPFDPVEDRRRAVGDWLIEHVGEEDGGRLVRMSRERDDYRVEYSRAFWRGNAGPVHGASVMRLNGLCGGFDSPQDPAAAVPAATIRAELADQLARCGVADAEAAAALEGFERAYALVSEWAQQAAAITAAEAQAIADYGMDMDMGADANMTMTDENMTGDAVDDPGLTGMNDGVEPESDPGMDLTPDAGDPD